MQLAILHHHLNPGGVTRVIENHLRALAAGDATQLPERVVLVHGGRSREWPREALQQAAPAPLEELVVEGADYDAAHDGASTALGERLASTLRKAGCGPDDTLVHWHNHSLGKNISTPLAVSRLAAEGYRLLLQVHDFAEDFRPQNYRRLLQGLDCGSAVELSRVLYPQAPHVHYAVLNGRDGGILATAGVPDHRRHLLPNPAASPPVAEDRAAARRAAARVWSLGDRPLALSPVRGIRRKNLGELLLWSAAVPGTAFALTLAPQNPVEQPSFRRWQQLARELGLACRLGMPVDAPLPFDQSLAASDWLLTTSVTEGFGMAFLEAWLADRELRGRNLPEITADFVEHGLDLSGLYQELRVPRSWLDLAALAENLTDSTRRTYEAFGAAVPGDLSARVQRLCETDAIDFARLPTRMQAAVIQRIGRRPLDRGELVANNQRMSAPQPLDGDRIDRNRATVEQHYRLAALAGRLGEVYRQVWESRPGTLETLPAGGAVLDALLSVERLHPLRVES